MPIHSRSPNLRLNDPKNRAVRSEKAEGKAREAAQQAFAAIKEEREFQDKKHGPLDKGGSHTIGEWILLMEAELAEAKLALLKGGTGRNSVLSEITQVAALGMACLEQHGTGEIKGRSV